MHTSRKVNKVVSFKIKCIQVQQSLFTQDTGCGEGVSRVSLVEMAVD